MNDAGNKPAAGGAESTDDDDGTGSGGGKTPGADIQPEDTGTPQSGNTGRATAAETAMKQTSKTGNETGSKR